MAQQPTGGGTQNHRRGRWYACTVPWLQTTAWHMDVWSAFVCEEKGGGGGCHGMAEAYRLQSYLLSAVVLIRRLSLANDRRRPRFHVFASY